MKILIVDDQRSARYVLRTILQQRADVLIAEADSVEAAVQLIGKDSFDLAFIDLRLRPTGGDRSGLDVVEALRRQSNAVPIVVSSVSELEDVRAAMRTGVQEYVLKDELCDDIVWRIIDRLHEERQLREEVVALRARQLDVSSEMIGHSDAMAQLRTTIERVAGSGEPLMVTGPTGAGKELVVKMVHRLRGHTDERLFDVNCGAIPETLMESMLFGHEKGAFSGAERRQEGAFAAVRNGTLFLDEIAELPLGLQAKLLRVIETRTFRPLGATVAHKFEGRIVTATHVDLLERVAQRTFREDLYYRLDVLRVSVPPLAARREDIPDLIAHFVKRTSSRRHGMRFSEDAMARLSTHDWPGNIRELRNLIVRLDVFAGDVVSGEDVGRCLARPSRNDQQGKLSRIADELLALDVDDKITSIEDALITQALARAAGNKTEAARLLGVHRKVIERRTRPTP